MVKENDRIKWGGVINKLAQKLMIKISEISLTQRFDDSMSSFSSEKNKKVKNFTT